MGSQKWNGGILNFNIREKIINILNKLLVKNKLFIIIE